MSESAYRRARYRINQAYRRRQVSLDLSSFQLDELPTEIGQLVTLRHLYLRSNHFTTLPSEIGQLTGLTHLDLESNRLSTLPPGLLRLAALKTLDLRSNRLVDLPAEVGQLSELRTLFLMRNALRTLPAEVGQLAKLGVLELGDNQLVGLPSEIGGLAELHTLRVGNNSLSVVPPDIGRLTKLRTLSLIENHIEALPPEIGNLKALQHLHVGKNLLSALPPDVVRLRALRTLSLNDNLFAVLPPEIVRLSSLTSLNLANNQLTMLPAGLVWLEALQTLNLEQNDLRSVPAEIGQLMQLRRLNINSNKLRTLPLAFGRLTSLSSTWRSDFDPRTDGLFVEGNPLPDTYSSLIAEGQPLATSKILALLRGEIEPEGPRGDLEQPEVASPILEPPPLPSQGVGPHFEVDDKGVIRFAPPEALDRHGNNVRRLRALHPTIRCLARELAVSLGKGNSPHGHLCGRIEAYRDLVDQELESVDFSLMYIEGVRVANSERATVHRIEQGELPAIDLSDREMLDTMLQLHANFMMSTTEGIEAIAEEERYSRRPEEEMQYRAAAVDFAENLQNNPDVIDQDVASVVLGAAEQIGLGANLERSGVVGTATLRNVTIILATGATVALPVIGGLLLGPGGLIAGGLAGYMASEGVKRSNAFGSVIRPLSKGIDGASELEIPKLMDGVSARLRPQLNFVLKMEQKLRQLAGGREQFAWVHEALDWIKGHAKDDEGEAS